MEEEKKVELAHDSNENSEVEEKQLENHDANDEQTPDDLGEAIAQKKHWREKAKKLEEELNTLKTQKPEQKEEVKKVVEQPRKKGEEPLVSPEDYTDVKLSNPELQKEDIYQAAQWAKMQNMTLQETIKSDFYSAYLDKKYAEQRSQQASPGTSSRSGVQSGVDVEKIVNNPKGYHSLTAKQKEAVKKQLGW